ncbi:hypothetical protein [Brevibacillus sp. SYSU BS000544]|uniref:hypothetical protein n=1 Tax=Brevibacillus sp. SYSU BS000544 TaxID=3416443 RepID=UPI003CE4AF5D
MILLLPLILAISVYLLSIDLSSDFILIVLGGSSILGLILDSYVLGPYFKKSVAELDKQDQEDTEKWLRDHWKKELEKRDCKQ